MNAATLSLPVADSAVQAAAIYGLTTSPQKSLPPWLFYDEAGSRLFERITALPEYYLTRTEAALFTAHADDIFRELDSPLTIAELGAGSAAKTGILLRAATTFQPDVLYQPIDISPSALEEAANNLTAEIPGVTVAPQVANYVTERYAIRRLPRHKVLALYIGSSIGNFSPQDAVAVLCNLRHYLKPGDALLLGTDLAPGEHKSVATLLAAYDDAEGVTAAFNKNILVRLNRELGATFDLSTFAHRVRWNAEASRIEMHLESLRAQTVEFAGTQIPFEQDETIHTENSYKFTAESLASLLNSARFRTARTFASPERSFAVTLATAI